MTDTALYFEDLQPGMKFRGGEVYVELDAVYDFAHRYDPQTFHINPEAALDSVFSGLAVSGWQTASLTMRMLTQSPLARIANGLVGMQVDEMRWPVPVRPEDTLRAEFEILHCQRSRSKPGFGVVTVRWQTHNQHHELVMHCINKMWVQARTTGEVV